MAEAKQDQPDLFMHFGILVVLTAANALQNTPTVPSRYWSGMMKTSCWRPMVLMRPLT